MYNTGIIGDAFLQMSMDYFVNTADHNNYMRFNQRLDVNFNHQDFNPHGGREDHADPNHTDDGITDGDNNGQPEFEFPLPAPPLYLYMIAFVVMRVFISKRKQY